MQPGDYSMLQQGCWYPILNACLVSRCLLHWPLGDQFAQVVRIWKTSSTKLESNFSWERKRWLIRCYFQTGQVVFSKFLVFFWWDLNGWHWQEKSCPPPPVALLSRVCRVTGRGNWLVFQTRWEQLSGSLWMQCCLQTDLCWRKCWEFRHVRRVFRMMLW